VVERSYLEEYTDAVLSTDCSLKSVAAKVSVIVFPIFIVLIAVFAVLYLCPEGEQVKAIEQLASSRGLAPAASLPARVQEPIKIEFQGSSQYDMPGERPPACTFHAVQAMKRIGGNFDLIAGPIVRRGKGLYLLQKAIIQGGLANYAKATLQKPKFQEGADLEDMREFIPENVVLGASMPAVYKPGEGTDSDVAAIVDSLFADSGDKVKIAWVKNANEESFALISKKDQVILFDSHKNEICMYFTKDQVRTALLAKLDFGGEGGSPFDYALGFFG